MSRRLREAMRRDAAADEGATSAPRRDYEEPRPDFRRRIMQTKDRRRVLVGEHCSVHFESRDTMLYQVQEMLRVEDSWDRAGAVEDELEAYNPLIPGPGELSATIMFEYETPEERARASAQVRGHRPARLAAGRRDRAACRPVFDRGQIDEHKVSSVQYIKWTLDDERGVGCCGRRARWCGSSSTTRTTRPSRCSPSRRATRSRTTRTDPMSARPAGSGTGSSAPSRTRPVSARTAERVYSFDLEGRPISWFADGACYKRSLASDVLRTASGRRDGSATGCSRRRRRPRRFAGLLRRRGPRAEGRTRPEAARPPGPHPGWTPERLLAERGPVRRRLRAR